MRQLLFETLTLYNSIDLLLILKSSQLADFSLIFALDFSVVAGLVFHSYPLKKHPRFSSTFTKRNHRASSLFRKNNCVRSQY